MEQASLLAFFAMGLGLGIVHAFDPDHLAAVGGMASGSSKNHKLKPWQFALHWSLGHGGILLLIAALVFVLGLSIPHTLSHWAEQLVAFMLISIGLWGYWRIVKNKGSEKTKTTHAGAWFVGVIHGTAGSAPLLTLIPLTQIGEPVVGLVYVLLFGMGVSLAMTSFGKILTHFMQVFQRQSSFWRNSLQIFLASFSFLFGCYLAAQ